jgi:hypothetical protein
VKGSGLGFLEGIVSWFISIDWGIPRKPSGYSVFWPIFELVTFGQVTIPTELPRLSFTSPNLSG